MSYFDLDNKALMNGGYRHVLPKQNDNQTTQIALQRLMRGEYVPLEKHEKTIQIVSVVEGESEIIIDSDIKVVSKGDVIVIEPGRYHEIINNSDSDFRFWTFYSKPEHKFGIYQVRQPEEVIAKNDNGLEYNIKYDRKGYILRDNDKHVVCEEHKIFHNLKDLLHMINNCRTFKCPFC